MVQETVQEPVQETVQDMQQNNSIINDENKQKKVMFNELNIEETKIINEINRLMPVNSHENIVKNIKKILKDDTIQISTVLKDFNSYYLDENIKNIELQKKDKNMINIEFLDKKYIIKCHSLKSSNINMYSIHNSPILKENIIQNHKIALHLDENNSSYLFFFQNNKYLLNKVGQQVLLTKLQTKKTIILKNNNFFKILNHNYYITNNNTLMVPINNKQFFDNSKNKMVHFFEPYI